MTIRILVIEDDPDIRGVVRLHLEGEKYEVVTATDGTEGLARADRTMSLVILDLGLPGMDGFEVCRALSKRSPRPLILILTARSGEIDRVRGLNLGADDYLVKPFSMMEFLARVRALLRRPALAGDQSGNDATVRTVAVGALVVDFWERCARIDGRRIELTAREFDLLAWFSRNPSRVFSRAELLDAVWGQAYSGYEHTVNSHLNRLRSKLERDPARPTMLVTVRGGGYKLVPPESSTVS